MATTDPFAGMPGLPLPPDLASPGPDADAWLERVTAEAVTLAEDAGLSPAEAAYRLAETTEPLAGAGERWTVTDDASAEWAMRHVAAATAQLDKLAQQAKSWQDRIAAWFDHRASPLAAKIEFMGAHLERYALRVREADPKRKTLVLPSGAVSTTASSARVVVADEARARAWAGQHAQEALQPQPPKLLVSALRNYVRPVELITEADLSFTCGDVFRRRDPAGLVLPDVGTEMECSDHGAVLLGRVDVLATRWVPQCTTDGTLAEGCDVDPGGVTARVVPAP